MHRPFNLHDTEIPDAPLSTSMTGTTGLDDMFERIEDKHRSMYFVDLFTEVVCRVISDSSCVGRVPPPGMMSMLAQLTSDFSNFAEPRVHLCPQHATAITELAQLAVARTDERVEEMEQRVEQMKQRMAMMEQRLEKLERKLGETEGTEAGGRRPYHIDDGVARAI